MEVVADVVALLNKLASSLLCVCFLSSLPSVDISVIKYCGKKILRVSFMLTLMFVVSHHLIPLNIYASIILSNLFVSRGQSCKYLNVGKMFNLIYRKYKISLGTAWHMHRQQKKSE